MGAAQSAAAVSVSEGSADEPVPASAPFASMSAAEQSRFRRVVEEQLDFVWRCLRRLGVPELDADDATQQVLLVLAGRLREVPEGNERAFLFSAATRIAANARRSLRRRFRAHESMLYAPRDNPPLQEELSEQLRARALLDEVLETMPDDLREVFLLFEIEEVPIVDIAQMLGLPMGTVGSRLRRARKAFQEALTRYKAAWSFRTGGLR